MIEKNPALQKLIDDLGLVLSVHPQSAAVTETLLNGGERKPEVIVYGQWLAIDIAHYNYTAPLS